MEITIAGNGIEPGTVLVPGDTLDLGTDGLVMYFTPEQAGAVRVFLVESQVRVRRAIAVTEARLKKENHP